MKTYEKAHEPQVINPFLTEKPLVFKQKKLSVSLFYSSQK